VRETAKASAACAAYLAQPPGRRSLRRLAIELDRPPAYVRQLERWSSAFGWQDRAARHDAKVLGRAQDDADKMRQLALSELQDGAVLASRVVRDIIEDQRVLPVLDRHGEVLKVPLLKRDGTVAKDSSGEPIMVPALKPVVSAATKVNASQLLLACIGVVPVKRVTLEHLGEGAATAAAEVIGRMDNDGLALIRAHIAARREQEALAIEPVQDPEPTDD
jgi:hypothetical protein